MKRLMIAAALLAVVAGAYHHFTVDSGLDAAPVPVSIPGPALQADGERQQPPPSFKCDGRQHCSQMTTRAEAEFFVRSCPGTKMGGDHDGEPCENDSRF